MILMTHECGMIDGSEMSMKVTVADTFNTKKQIFLHDPYLVKSLKNLKIFHEAVSVTNKSAILTFCNTKQKTKSYKSLEVDLKRNMQH